ncbi:MAG: hypothetical protein JST67_09685 [Bacteroidetes bacterium]|nr:hypothetical protein [Bacteroidota bacterium]
MKVFNEPLFELIHSLTKAEKRFFSVYAKRHVVGEKNLYLSLFHEIEKQREYDEKKLIPGLKKKGIKVEYLSQSKYYLYKLLLQSLNIYHKDSFADAEITELILQVKILYRKGLIGQYEKILQKAKQLAYKHQNYLKLFEVLELEKLAILSTLENHANFPMEKIKLLKEEEEKLIHIKSEVAQFEWMEIRFNRLMVEHGSIRNLSQLDAYHKIINDTEVNAGKKPVSPLAKISYFETLAIYNSLSREFKTAIQHHLEVKSLFQSSPFYLEDNITSYVAVLANITQCAINTGNYSLAESQLNELFEISNRSDKTKANVKEAKIRALVYYTLLYLRMCIHTGQISKAKRMLFNMRKELTDLTGLMGKRNSMLVEFHIAQIHFIETDYREANKLLNKLVNDSYLKLSVQLESIVKIFQTLVHLELGNDQLAEYLLNSTYRLINKDKEPHRFEKLFLSGLKKALKNPFQSEEFKADLIPLRKKLMELLKNPFEQRPLDYFDFISWIDARLNDKTVLETLRAKINPGGKLPDGVLP